MRTILTAAALIGLSLATPALAQPATPAPAPSATAPASGATATTPPAPGAMQAAVRHDLEQAGFTDVQVMPSSFLVRAKDKSGRPVMMVINPDSVTEITNVGQPADTTKK